MPTTLCWFRRDLRLEDHPALHHAARLAAGSSAFGCFVADQRFLGTAGVARRRFLAGALGDLAEQMDGALVLRAGDPAKVLVELCAEVGATVVVATGEHSPAGMARDAKVAATLRAAGVDLELVDSNYLVEPGLVRSGTGSGFKVFTPYYKAALQLGVPAPIPVPDLRWGRAPSTLAPVELLGPPLAGAVGPRSICGTIDAPPPTSLPEASHHAATARLEAFAHGVVDAYGTDRDLLEGTGTSGLSPYLRFGLLHPRQVVAALGQSEGAVAFHRQLCWRDFYADVLFHTPAALWEDLHPTGVEVDTGPIAIERFGAWALGQTGYPAVDAGMRQLLAEGSLHNRARMLCASFLVKDLHLDWRWGAAWFAERLVDFDPASNNCGWQWVAGVGTDASPYHRIFNPTLQALRFDPEGRYVARWVPELASVPLPQRLEPGAGGGSLFAGAYPAPVVEHATERAVALERLAAAKARR